MCVICRSYIMSPTECVRVSTRERARAAGRVREREGVTGGEGWGDRESCGARERERENLKEREEGREGGRERGREGGREKVHNQAAAEKRGGKRKFTYMQQRQWGRSAPPGHAELCLPCV
jgi:hypothetical protein